MRRFFDPLRFPLALLLPLLVVAALLDDLLGRFPAFGSDPHTFPWIGWTLAVVGGYRIVGRGAGGIGRAAFAGSVIYLAVPFGIVILLLALGDNVYAPLFSGPYARSHRPFVLFWVAGSILKAGIFGATGGLLGGILARWRMRPTLLPLESPTARG